MFCKQFLALFLWCHCYQIVLNPLLQLLALGHNQLSNIHPNNGGGHSQFAFYVAGVPITAAANKVTLNPGHEISLSCKIEEFPEVKFTWFMTRRYPYKDAISSYEEDKREQIETNERYTIGTNMMTIKSSTLADVGDYFCQVKDQVDGVAEQEKMILVRPKPYIHDFNLNDSTMRSAIVEEGKSLKIPCNVADDYFTPDRINVTWHMSRFDETDMNDVIPGEDGIKIERHNSTSQDLIIDHVTKDHRRYYKCLVSNGVTENSKSILIRVKDKYKAIWPAVGIVLELVILIGVICVVENRKVEPDRGAYDRKAIQM